MNESGCIFLNDNIHNHSAQRGVARYFRKVVEGVIGRFGRNATIFSPEVRDYGAAKHIHSVRFRGSRYVNDVIASIAACFDRSSVFYSPYYGNARTRAAEIFTVHDMTYELFPEYFPADQYSVRSFINEKRRCFERADALIAISESTARDIVTYYPHIDFDKIVVIYHGVDEFFFESDGGNRKRIGKPYFIYVGRRTLYKNFLRLLVAFGESGFAKEFDLRVISPTRNSFNSQEVECISKYRLQESVCLARAASDEELRESYAGAVALVYPSEYEGFGLSILEAMACGTLVATSNTSSMPEVGGEVAFYFDPTDTESMIECLRQVVDLPTQQRRERIMRGIERAKQFSWSRCQKQTIEIFRKFL